MSTVLDAARREADIDALADGGDGAAGGAVDVLVVGAGVTGAGVALDAASRGLKVALVERGDLAHGTSRWSSKLVHGGLRYLAKGQVGVAMESARERGILLETTAPHLVRTLPMVLPLHEAVGAANAVAARAGMAVGDVLRVAAGTGRRALPRSRRLTAEQTVRLLPGVRAEGLRGGVLSFDGQLTDDARLVVALARTAAGFGARVVTRCAAERLGGDGAVLRDLRSGRRIEVRARAVVNAAGVYAGELVPDVRLRPSRGTHIVLRAEALGRPKAALMVPVPGTANRFVFALPQVDGRVFAGLTDEPVDGPLPEVPEAPEEDVAFLLEVLNRALGTALERSDVAGAYAGLRPLLEDGGGRGGPSADLSRRHAVLRSGEGVLTVVGGKLTTYRRMAEEAVDAAVESVGLRAGACRTRALPVVGAAPWEELDAVEAPRRLIARYGTEAPEVMAMAEGDPELLRPVAAGVTGAEMRFAVKAEGALEAEDILDRRTRLGLVAEDREAGRQAAEDAIKWARSGASGRRF
ncbi:glycerol-3-phosphate dehydrogenase/oxidase [Nocardiopsis sp. RSe5-2]|uniref:Glycerol-3-phosphate dehydrogenase/oxidase n=1 Tax=Nocardiopsis endophytica TaxID=3018445 RepID=A0ABT4U0K5_9ACTN|nr:glycerol-3-phosphate dehydrogenase/oxidase [Nocardiopsis endophytica]MDA2810478.1 glycerol-3-phosphate dehydrogenase/oxidase [Nocardiopsis endophytica]